MLGDATADAYAALMPQYGFRPLVSMLTEACDKGVENVPDAPPELVAFIREMEATPAWIGMSLIDEERGQPEPDCQSRALRGARRFRRQHS